MFISSHAADRALRRLPIAQALDILDLLERVPGQLGTVGYVAARLAEPVECDDGSNGSVVWAVAQDGLVASIYIRRGEQGPPPGLDREHDLVIG